jgi:oligopeptide/dipeptide ABC transporter ATP-binding protein
MPSIPGMVPNLERLPAGCRFNPRCGQVMAICHEAEPALAEVAGGHLARCWLHSRQAEAPGAAP